MPLDLFNFKAVIKPWIVVEFTDGGYGVVNRATGLLHHDQHGDSHIFAKKPWADHMASLLNQKEK